MLYYLIKFLAVLSLERFFDKIIVEHKERIHPDHPTIYVANHPNTMMDAMVAGYAVGKRIHFTAKSTIFANPVASWFLKKVGLVPIYRREDNPDQMGKNEDIFIRLYEHLETGSSFLIFPEGISISDRLLHEIKTGAARIAFGAEVRNKFSLNVQIVPVGLNYSDYQKFRSDVYCRFGYPIFINEYKDNYEEDPIRAVKEVTEKIKHQLEKVTTTLPESELSDLVDFVNTIYKKDLMVEMGLETKSVEDEFFVTKGIIDAVEWYKHHHPEITKIMSKEMGNYLRTLQRLQLRDDFLSPARKGIKFKRRLKSWFFLVIGFPVFLWGAINNFPGYKIPRVLTDRITHEDTFISSVKLMVGIAAFVLFYTIQIWLSWFLFHNKLISIIYGLTLVPSGNFALEYYRRAQNYRQHLIFLSLFYRKRSLIYGLIQKRMALIESLNEAKEEFLSMVEKQKRTSEENQ